MITFRVSVAMARSGQTPSVLTAPHRNTVSPRTYPYIHPYCIRRLSACVIFENFVALIVMALHVLSRYPIGLNFIHEGEERSNALFPHRTASQHSTAQPHHGRVCPHPHCIRRLICTTLRTFLFDCHCTADSSPSTNRSRRNTRRERRRFAAAEHQGLYIQ